RAYELLVRRRLASDVRKPRPIRALERAGGELTTEVAVDAALVDIEDAVDVLRQSVRAIRHSHNANHHGRAVPGSAASDVQVQRVRVNGRLAGQQFLEAQRDAPVRVARDGEG